MGNADGAHGGAALLALQVAQRACTRCVEAGFLGAAHPVFSGRAGQRMLLVGQAPGPVEHDRTRPFAGRAGRQLMRWFERGGFAGEEDVRRRVYMTSMTTCFPGRTADGRGDRRPGSREVALCSEWLDGVLRILAPRLVIPIGGLALARFLPGRGLEDAIGRLFDGSGAEIDAPRGAPVLLPLPHPSGQSRWLNDPAHAGRLERALARLPELAHWAESG
ncbi:MAG: uracil-DNA glycosylase family protein [Candidatus Dormibacteria bacterium]